MASTVTFVVDLDAAGAPPATDSVRQLLALLEGLQEQDRKLDWRLTSISTNSPLRAQVSAFDDAGAPVPEALAKSTAEAAFRVLDATNDNERDLVVARLSDDGRKRLRALIAPLRDRGGLVKIEIAGQVERVVTGAAAQATILAIAPAPRKRRPELGSIEGQILAATTYYGSPALKLRAFLTGDEITCVFSKSDIDAIGAEHSLAEVWAGKRVLVSGKISFDAAGRATTIQADDLRILGKAPLSLSELDLSGAAFVDDDWGGVH